MFLILSVALIVFLGIKLIVVILINNCGLKIRKFNVKREVR